VGSRARLLPGRRLRHAKGVLAARRNLPRGRDHEVQRDKAFGKLSGFAFCLLVFERVDDLDGREEADLAAMMFDGLHGKGCRDMRFAGATPSRALLQYPARQRISTTFWAPSRACCGQLDPRIHLPG